MLICGNEICVMQFLLNLQPEEIVLEPMDIDDINRMTNA